MKAIYVEWVDALSISGWTDKKDPDISPQNVKTLGWLIKENNKMIAMSACDSGKEVNAVIVVPKGWIIKRKWVKI